MNLNVIPNCTNCNNYFSYKNDNKYYHYFDKLCLCSYCKTIVNEELFLSSFVAAPDLTCNSNTESMYQRNSVYNESYTRLSQLDFLTNHQDLTTTSPTSLSVIAQTNQAPFVSKYQPSSPPSTTKETAPSVNQALRDKFAFKPNDETKSLQVIQTSQIKLRLNQKAGDFLNHHRELIKYESPYQMQVYSANKYHEQPTATANHFIDEDFPHSKKSIFMSNKRIKLSSLLLLDGLSKAKTWLRPMDIKCDSDEKHLPITLFSNPNPKDVIQGGVGSCWFISALSALADRPELLYHTIMPKFYNANGFHQVRLCQRGQWVEIPIDDYLPCDRKKKLIFAYSKNRQFWTSFIEKALAKLNGSYEAISSGACVEGLQTLTGEPCEVLYLESAFKSLHEANGIEYNVSDESTSSSSSELSIVKGNQEDAGSVWRKIQYARSCGYLMTTLCYNKSLKYGDFIRVGLFNRHIYTILDAREFYHNGEMIYLLKLRNPWGKSEWKGEWSNKWKHWPEHLKLELKPEEEHNHNEGTFWIPYEYVLKYFYDITVCKVRSDWFESRQSSFFYDYSHNAQVYMINVLQPGTHQFEIELFSTGRKYEQFDRNADPNIDLCLILCQVTESGLVCVAYEHNVEYFITMSAALTSGKYMLFATSMRAISNLCSEPSTTSDPNYYTYNLVVHGQSNFYLNQAIYDSHIVSDLFYSVALKLNNVKYDLNNIVRTMVVRSSCAHGFFIENLSYNQTLMLRFDGAKSQNIRSSRSTVSIESLVKPRTRQLVNFMTPENYHKGFAIGYRITSEIVDNTVCMSHVEQNIVPKCFSGLHAISSIRA